MNVMLSALVRTAVAAVMLLSGAARSLPAHAQTLTLETKIALGAVQGRIDHMAIDPVRKRLFIAELGNDSVGVVDLAAGKVMQRIAGLSEPQGVAYELSTDMLYVANGGDGSVRMFRGSDFAESGRLKLGEDADNIRLDPAHGRVLVGYGNGGIAAIDASRPRRILNLALPAHPEGFQIDRATGAIFVNVPRAALIAVIDGNGGERPATWPLKGVGGNFPMALDESQRRVLVAFRAPPRLGVFAMAGGQSIASVDLCGDADDVFVDAQRHRAYVSCGQGFIDVFDIESPDFQRLGRLATAPGARTAYFAPAFDRLYLAVRATSGEPAAIWVFRPEP